MRFVRIRKRGVFAAVLLLHASGTFATTVFKTPNNCTPGLSTIPVEDWAKNIAEGWQTCCAGHGWAKLVNSYECVKANHPQPLSLRKRARKLEVVRGAVHEHNLLRKVRTDLSYTSPITFPFSMYTFFLRVLMVNVIRLSCHTLTI